MLNNISWASYFYATLSTLCIYYIVILCIYYRSEFVNFFKRFKQIINADPTNPASMPENYALAVMDLCDERNNHTQVRQLLLNLQSALIDSGEKNLSKQELSRHIQEQLLLATFVDIFQKQKLNDFIIAGCKTYCSAYLTEDEAMELWTN